MFALLFAAAVAAAEPAPPPRPVALLDEQLDAAEVAVLRADLAAANKAPTADDAFAALDRIRGRVREAIRELNPGRHASRPPTPWSASPRTRRTSRSYPSRFGRCAAT